MMAHSPPLRTQTATGAVSGFIVQMQAGQAVGAVVAVLWARWFTAV